MSLIRKKLVFNIENDGLINYNYNYDVMKVIYNAITEVDKAKSLRLHEKGFKIDNKKFKLFNFSLFFINYKNTNNGIEVTKDNKLELTLSGDEKVIELIVRGFIKLQYFELYDVKFKIEDMLSDRSFKFNKIMLYKVRTPIVESIFDVKTRKTEYLNTFDGMYYNALAQNLMRKYELIYGEKYNGELYFDIENVFNVKKRYITNIKNGYIIGYSDFEIFIEAEPRMQKISYFLGLGQNNSLGMGMLSYITGRRE